MRIFFYDAHEFETKAFEAANSKQGLEIEWCTNRLTPQSAVLARGFEVACLFVEDRADAQALKILKEGGVRLIALRSAGFNHVDLKAAHELGLVVVRVPEYSPYAVAEHAAALLMALNRKIPRAVARVKDLNFSLEGLVGRDLHGQCVGVVGTGRIGRAFARIMLGFGCRVLAYDKEVSSELTSAGVRYVPLQELIVESDVISLHIPLTPKTRHLIDAKAFASMKPGSLIVNTGRGALIDSVALLHTLKSGRLGGAALDVYEEEEGIFFHDLSGKGLKDDVLARLLSFPNVIVTSHQAFLTQEALRGIAEVTLANVAAFARGERSGNEVEAV
jgi:D-lactate dehydrogenase